MKQPAELMTYNVMDIRQNWFKRIPGTPAMKSESALMYAIKNILRDSGLNVVKKLMWKDGHLVNDTQYYIRERRGKWCLWDTEYQVRNLAEDYNRGETIHLQYEE